MPVKDLTYTEVKEVCKILNTCSRRTPAFLKMVKNNGFKKTFHNLAQEISNGSHGDWICSDLAVPYGRLLYILDPNNYVYNTNTVFKARVAILYNDEDELKNVYLAMVTKSRQLLKRVHARKRRSVAAKRKNKEEV